MKWGNVGTRFFHTGPIFCNGSRDTHLSVRPGLSEKFRDCE